MNNLQIKTTKLEPATIVFNHKEIEKELDNTLAKYRDLIFTEENTTDLRNTIADLRKGQSALNRYRIDTKKELNKTGNEFDVTVKELDSKFVSVISPLVEQQIEFEETRKAEKFEEVQAILNDIAESLELDHEYIDQLEIADSFLTKSKSIKSITEELTAQAELLRLKQDKVKSDKETIETTVKLANAENDMSLSFEAYVRLLEFQEVEKIKEQIANDVEKEVANREYKLEQERIKKEQAEERKQAELKNEPVVGVKHDQAPLSSTTSSLSIDDLPFSDIDDFDPQADPFADDYTHDERVYAVNGTIEQLNNLQEYMNRNNLDWSVE